MHPGGHLRGHGEGRPGGLPGRGQDPYPGLLSQGRGVRHPAAADVHPGGGQRGGLLRGGQLRRRPDRGEEALLRPGPAGAAGGAGVFPVLRQLHQLGPGAAPDRLLRLRLLRPAAGRAHPEGGQDQRLRPHRQLRQHPGGLLRRGDGGAHREAHLRLQRQQCAHRFPEHRRVRPQPRLPQHHVPLHGHSHLLQPGAAALRPVRPRRRPGAGLHGPAGSGGPV